MDWLEVSLQASGEIAEPIADLLQQYGYQGVVIEQLGVDGDAWEDDLVYLPDQVIVRAYLPNDTQAPILQKKLEAGLGHLHMITPNVPTKPSYSVVKEEDWAEAWKVHYKPLRIGRFYVRPEWIESQPPADAIELVLDPGMAFGTGTHPSTQLCLIALAGQTVPAKVLDLGCGSGILGIAAAKMGATDVWALDTDDLAITSTAQNAERNNVRHHLSTIEQGSLANILDKQDYFELLLVNILAKIIIPMCEQGLGSIVAPGGIAIFSGIIEEQADDVEAALRQTGLIPYKRHQMADWIGIEARRKT